MPLTKIIDGGMSAGAVLQVVQTVDTTQVSSSGYSSFTDLGGLSVTITPSSSSNKIMLLTTIGTLDHSQNTYQMHMRYTRNGTAILTQSSGSQTTTTQSVRGILSGDTNGQNCCVIPLLIDTPSSTSALTYKVQLYNYNGNTFYYNRTANNTDSAGFNAPQSTITAMEIAG
jgi:hypothetical protein